MLLISRKGTEKKCSPFIDFPLLQYAIVIWIARTFLLIITNYHPPMTCWLFGCSNLYLGAVICSVLRSGLEYRDLSTINIVVGDYQILHLPVNFLILVWYSYLIKFLPKTQNLMEAPDLPITENSINHLLMVARAYPPSPFRCSFFLLSF